ncbi:MAG: hypothetical protein DRJ42_25940 [Deltaproteobacteria bacterium]|nr:MAG: hypothetical protein DRJ42_25940 [Deltaproteobacteria bacterium]
MARGLLQHVPTQPDLERLYYELERIGAPSVGRRAPWPYEPATKEALAGLAGEMLRYDPRLLSVLLQLFLEGWMELNPLALRTVMQTMRWPQALLVVLEFARAATRDVELRYFADYLGAGFVRMSPAERFFLDAERPGSRMARRKSGRNFKAYARWGFIGTERPTANATSKRLVGSYDTTSRAWVRRQLADRRGPFKVSEYLDALDDAISRQQAYKDLRDDPEFVVEGRGRGARWRRKKRRSRSADRG